MSTSGSRSATGVHGVGVLCPADRPSEGGSSRPDGGALLQTPDEKLPPVVPGSRLEDDGRVRA